MSRSAALAAISLTIFCLACSGGPQAANSDAITANVVSSTNIIVTPPPGQSPPPEIVLNGNLAERTNQKRTINLPAGDSRSTGQSFDAPEDSSITTSMDPHGKILETRVFRSHPQLAKVEATWTSAREKVLKIYLKDGNMREVRTSDLANLRSATSAQILELAGIRAKVPTAPEKGETRVKGNK